MEEKLYDAVRHHNEDMVREILRDFPNVNVNWRNEKADDSTAFDCACTKDLANMAALLLAHPDIDVNQKNEYGNTAFTSACVNGSASCVRVLLQDSRVNPNEPDNSGFTPLWWAAYRGNLDMVESWIVSGREMDLGIPGEYQSDAIEEARERQMMEVAVLLERFKRNPKETRHEVRLELMWFDEVAAGMFALVVFLSDGLLQVATGAQSKTPAARFFKIASKLPLELQMVLCYRFVGSAKEIVSGRDSEPAFRKLIKSY